jgi:tetratricopeptide (TPR) repeat protein
MDHAGVAAETAPVPDVDAVIAKSNAALVAKDFERALGILRASVAVNPVPELYLRLGQLEFIGGDINGSPMHCQTAVTLFETRGRYGPAAVAATWVAAAWVYGLGNRVAARGWFARARRLIDQCDLCVERGWVLAAEVGCAIADLDELEARSLEALDIARRFGDPDLEARALGNGGVAFVTKGLLGKGMGWIDEAMAMAISGAPRDPITFGEVACCLMSACERAGDFGRAEAWMHAFDQQGSLDPRNLEIFTGHCHSAYGAVLADIGRWHEAEPMLAKAVEENDRTIVLHQAGARGSLAMLRIRQGRLDEAESLLLGYEDFADVFVPLARLHLARGDHELAVAVAERGLRMMTADQLRGCVLLAVLSQARLALGDVAGAWEAHRRLTTMAEANPLPLSIAESALVASRLLAADGKVDEAVMACELGISALPADVLPLLRAELHLELARVQAERDPTAAEVAARAAVAIYRRVGAPPPETDLPLLHRLGVLAATAPRQARIRCEEGIFVLSCGGTTVRLKSSKGLAYLADLIAHPGVERHVLDLVDLVESPAEPGLNRRQLGDAGELLDAKAKSAYRHRLQQLREQLDEADELGDDERGYRIQAEIDALSTELRRALGLGGRDRRACSAAERARLNVTRAIRTAITRVTEAAPELGACLDRSIRTGTYCCYDPTPADRIHWR